MVPNYLFYEAPVTLTSVRVFSSQKASSVELASNFQFGTTGSTIHKGITSNYPRGCPHTHAHRHAKETTGTQHTRAGKTRPRWLRAGGYRDRYSGAIKLRPRRLRVEGYARAHNRSWLSRPALSSSSPPLLGARRRALRSPPFVARLVPSRPGLRVVPARARSPVAFGCALAARGG